MIRHEYIDPFLCHIDPISIGAGIASIASAFGGTAGASTLAAGALAGGAAAGVSSLASGGSSPSTPAAAPAGTAPTPTTPAAPPPGTDPTGTRSSGATRTPSFVGSAALPSQSGYGGKTLLGQ